LYSGIAVRQSLQVRALAKHRISCLCYVRELSNTRECNLHLPVKRLNFRE